MQKIIEPIPVEAIKSELTHEVFMRQTNNGHNEIYIIDHINAPQTLREIGRLRELTFRAAGGGTGLDCDLDEFDLNDPAYQQLIVWNPIENEIVGGYRYIHCRNAINEKGEILLATTELFDFSQKFLEEFMPNTIELGRSFVQPKYQPSSENRKGLFSLDNLWDSLGGLVVDYPDVRYFFGKVTMYLHYDRQARDMILFFMNHLFPDKELLVTPKHSLPYTHNMESFSVELEGKSYKEAHAILNHHVRALGENIPPLINSYMNLSPSMKTFGTATNEHFGDVEETGILVTIEDIYHSKKDRHVNTYQKK